MNEFTKEELETIVDAFNFIHGAPGWRNTEGWDDKLQDKIQSMIDNYDKNQWNEFLDWFEENKYDLPEWIDKDMSMHECRLLWKERIKNDNQ